MKLIMLVGCPGCGKSTLARQLQGGAPNLVVLSADAILEKIMVRDKISYLAAYHQHVRQANRKVVQDARDAFRAGKDVVWDQMNLTRAARQVRLDLVPDAYEKIGVFFDADFGTLLSGTAARARAIGKVIPRRALWTRFCQLERPDYDEGFDRLILKKVAFGAAPAQTMEMTP